MRASGGSGCGARLPEGPPGTRNFTVRLGTQRSATVSENNRKEDLEGWAWEDGGVLDLAAGPTLVAIATKLPLPPAATRSSFRTISPATDGPPWKLNKPLATFVR